MERPTPRRLILEIATDIIPLVAILALDVSIVVLAAWRPWAALVVLLAVLPLNGMISQVLSGLLDLTPAATTALAAWHDALVAGIAVAAAISWLRSRRRPSTVEWLVIAMLGLGMIYVIGSPVRLTALYAYRTLYEPAILLLAIVVLARSRGLPDQLARTGATAFASTASLAALFAWPQVYVLGFRYLNTFYRNPGEPLHFSYLATGLNQPRGIGTLTSPNEFGAMLAMALILLAVPGLVRWPGWVRAWLFVACSLGLLLSFSRSGMLAAAVGLVVLALLSRDRWSQVRRIREFSTRQTLSYVAPVVVGLLMTVFVFSTSGAATLVQETVAGSEPSAQGRTASVREGVLTVISNPLGLGLGTAGPKSARFGESASPRILTEMWYLVYAIQVGIIGLGLLVATALAILLGLWRSRASPISRAALSMAMGLAIGALFIPIIDEPTIFTPLWAFCGLALAAVGTVVRVEKPSTVARPTEPTRAVSL